MKPLALLVHALCLGALASVAGAPAQAQTAGQAGQPESLRHYAIPAGPLEATLNRLGREAGLLIAFGSAATEGVRSGGYALRAASTPVAGVAGDGVQTMAPVTVSAQAEEETRGAGAAATWRGGPARPPRPTLRCWKCRNRCPSSRATAWMTRACAP
jgi:hypothetical protein